MILIAIVLFLAISIWIKWSKREGYYSDSNVTTAISSLENIPTTLNNLQSTLQGFESLSLDAGDTIRSLNSILGSSNSKLDTNGVITNVRERKNEVNLLQDNLVGLSSSLKKIKEIPISLNFGSESRTVPISEAIPLLKTQIQEIADKLRKIPET